MTSFRDLNSGHSLYAAMFKFPCACLDTELVWTEATTLREVTGKNKKLLHVHGCMVIDAAVTCSRLTGKVLCVFSLPGNTKVNPRRCLKGH